MKYNRILLWILLIALLFVFYFYTLKWLIYSWLGDPYYAHGFIVPVVSGFLIWQKRGLLRHDGKTEKGILILIVSMFLYLLGYFFSAGYISAFSLIICIIAIAFVLYGDSTKNILFPLCFLIFMVPLPFLESIGVHLQFISAHLSTFIINALGIPAEIAGTVIILGDRSFEIALSCSGINSLITLITAAVLFTYFIDCEIYKKITLVIIAIPIALFTNIIRVVSAILIGYHYGVELAFTLFHDIFSIIFFIISVISIIICMKLLKCKMRI